MLGALKQLHLPRIFPDAPAHDPSVPRSLLRHHPVPDSVLSESSFVTVDDDEQLPLSPGGPNYQYGPRDSRSPTHFSFGSATSYTATPFPYTTRDSSARDHSPSAIEPPTLPMGPLSAPHSQNRFYTQPRSYGALPKLYTSNILDQRRMSEPHLPQIAGANRAHQYNYDYNNNYEVETSRSPDSPFLPRVASLDSLRRQEWKQEPEDPRPLGDVSPFQPSFSSISGSPQYVLRSEENTYGPSPPGTATSSSSTATPAAAAQDSPEMGNKKTYSFVALPGNTVRKRPRRRYDEIERLYHCSWPECTKSYGTLNHLNAHVQMQKHGPKRSPNEFKELRKQWRKAKKEYESPSLGPIRRSMSLRSDDLYHGHPYNAPHRSFSHNTALSPPLSVSIPHGSYGVDQHLRYPPDTSGEIDPQQPYGGMEFRQPSAPTGWTPSTSRGEIYQSPLTAQPTYPYLDNSHPQMMESASSVNSSYNTSPARSTLGRLPPGSMLLTPLVQSADSYPEPYYDDEARDGQRLDSGSGDEY